MQNRELDREKHSFGKMWTLAVSINRYYSPFREEAASNLGWIKVLNCRIIDLASGLQVINDLKEFL